MILILLTILKIIGIILLVLLGLIVLLLCLLLFAPVRYRAKGAKHPDELSVSAFVSYLWPLVRVRVEYPSEMILSVKVLWIDLLHPKEKNHNKKANKKSDKSKQARTSEKNRESGVKRSETDIASKAEETPEDTHDSQTNNECVAAKPMRMAPETPVYQMDILPDECNAKDVQVQLIRKETAAAEENLPEQQSERSEESAAKKKKKAAPHTEKDTENKLVAIATLLWQYKEMYPDVLGRVFHAIKSILPRKCNIHLIFGTGSPDNTGYLYGAYCALEEFLPGTIVFEPVWMESYLDVEFELSGNIRLIHFVTAAVKIIADKRVRKLISEIRRL